jgi:hypothetical protein
MRVKLCGHQKESRLVGLLGDAIWLDGANLRFLTPHSKNTLCYFNGGACDIGQTLRAMDVATNAANFLPAR